MIRTLNRKMLPAVLLLVLLLAGVGGQAGSLAYADPASPFYPVGRPPENLPAGTGTQQAATDYTIRLHSRVFVPPPGLSAATRQRIITSGRARYHVLVQTKTILTTAERDGLKDLGLRLLV